MTKRILSCMQPTNRLQLGNYLGALRNWVKLQDEDGGQNQCLYGAVDLHAITNGHDVEALANATRETAAAYIAAGVDPKRSYIFAQSHVPEHAQLNWLFGAMTQMGKLERMTTHVPVGDDQKQHLELSRDIASVYNEKYAGGEEYFPLPEPYIMGTATRVMSLRDGTQKMSKSAESDMTRINLTDDAELIAKKFKKAKTDQGHVPASEKEGEGRPEAMNLIGIYAALADIEQQAVMDEFGGQQFSALKTALSDLAVAKLSPITSRMSELMNDKAEIDNILKAGADKARELAAPTLDDVYRTMGFLR